MSGNIHEFEYDGYSMNARPEKIWRDEKGKALNYAESERYRKIKAMKFKEDNLGVFGKIVTPTVPNFVMVEFEGSLDKIKLPVAKLNAAQKDALAAAWREDLDKVKISNAPVFRG